MLRLICSQHTSPATPCVSCSRIPCGTGKEGHWCLRVLSVPAQNQMMTMAAQLQPQGSGRAFPQVGLKKLLPQKRDQVRALQS